MRSKLLSFAITTLTLSLFIGASHAEKGEKEKKRPKRGSVSLGAYNQDKGMNDRALEMNRAFMEVSAKVSPSVVSVVTYRNVSQSPQQNMHPFFEYYFGVPPQQDPRNVPPQPEEKRRVPFGGGSGFIISADGYILTNNHVVEGADDIEVTLPNKKEYMAEVIGTDKKTDVAILKINPGSEKLVQAMLGDSKALQVGEWVVAIGNPFGYENTVTAGIVSQVGRRPRGYQMNGPEGYQNFIQTDAAVNPGNSGGPLVNLRGEVIGVNTLIVSRTGGYLGLSFAVPIHMAKKIAEDLIYDGKVTRGFLGITLQEVDSDMANALGLPAPQGCLVQDILKDTPAEKGGFKANDIVLSVGKERIEDCQHLRNLVADLHPDEKEDFGIMRESKRSNLSVKIGSRSEDSDLSVKDADAPQEGKDVNGTFYSKKIGLRFSAITKDLSDKYSLSKDSKGMVIVEVVAGSTANEKGLSEGDLILSFKRSVDKNFIDIGDGKTLIKSLSDMKSGESIALNISSKGRKAMVALKARN